MKIQGFLPGNGLTKVAVQKEAARILRLYRRTRQGQSGPEPEWKNFVGAAIIELKWIRTPGHRRHGLSKEDCTFIEKNFGETVDPNKVIRWIRGRRYQQMETAAFADWYGGAFRAALNEIVLGHAPREVARRFRIPGKKRSDRGDLARFRPMIEDMAGEVLGWKPGR